MDKIQEVWVNAVLMPTGEIICGGRTIGYIKTTIGSQWVKSAADYQLVPRRKSVNDAV
jgi:hypothetical protein